MDVLQVQRYVETLFEERYARGVAVDTVYANRTVACRIPQEVYVLICVRKQSACESCRYR